MNISFVMVTGDGQAKELPPMKLPITIGRSEDCKLRIPLAAVSRHHCEISEDDDELLVKDLKSSNGTYVNKERVASRELVPGDLLSVGAVVFVVRIDGHPKAIDPIIAWANGAVAPGEGGGPSMGGDGVPTWTTGNAPTMPVPAAKPGSSPALKSAPSSAPASKSAPGASGASQPAPASKPKPASKDEESFESLLADLSESDFDIDLPDDDEPPKKGPAAPGKK